MTERYELIGPLGTGGMAEVLLARRVGPNGFERLLAVKRIRPERAQDPDLVRMLLDEARNAASLVHQRIVQVFDIGMRDGVVELAMEYLHGKTLEDVLARQPRLPIGAAVAIAIAIADGLHHAHSRASPIVHRDVSPSNVMITYDGSVKLIDFGIAKAANNLSNTVYGTFKGRLGYSSPEQCRCELIDARTDIYSLAVLLYEMTTGARAFTARDELGMLAVMTEARVTPPTKIDPQFPPHLETIIMKGLAADRSQRYETAHDMQQDLEVFAVTGESRNLSESAMARLMHDLFASELVTWIRDREIGVTLEDHVARAVTLDAQAFAHQRPRSIERTATLDADALEQQVPRPVAYTATIVDPPKQVTRTVTLEDHVGEPATRTQLDLDRATTVLPTRRRRPASKGLALPIALVVALLAVAYVVTRLVLTAP